MAEIFDFYVADNRTIKFNPIEPILQEDNGVAMWRFRIPKVLNNIDMSGFAWWFVYINAAKQKYSEPLTLTADIDDPDNYCIADYTIDYGISLTPGSFTFALEAINANGSGDIIEEWHTKTYSHSVIGTLQGNQAEYSETESDIISALIVQIQQKYNSLVGGATPIPVASVSQMTDTSKIYLLTTDKNWYYYNGTAWVSGGLYASGIVIDPTLTQSGQAADAKAVGDEISDLKSAINNDEQILGLDWIYGFIGANGSLSAGGTDRLASRFIPCPPGTSITYVSETNHANVCGIAFYNKFTTFISGEKNNATIGTPATTISPAGTAYLRLSTKVAIKDQTYLTFSGNNKQVLAWLQDRVNNLSIYVDGANGNDSTGAGTSGSPYKTIGKALQMGGRNICVKPGTYQEKVNASFLEYLHIYADRTGWASGTPNVPKVIIDGNSTIDTPLELSYIRNLFLDDIIIQYSESGKNGCVITNCEHLEMQNCEFHHNGNNGCVINYTNGIVHDCKADYNGNDGFNINYYGDTQFYNCSGHDNVDDGISHHQGTTGMINGGEWYNNGKGGVASPAHGAQVDIYNVYCHDNGYGIYANADSDTTARTFHVWNSVLVNNRHYGITSKRNTAIMYNCKITGNTDGQTTAPAGGQIITL